MLEILRKVFDFSSWQASHPGEPPPGNMLDASFDAQDRKINELTLFIEGVKRFDGHLQNGLVDWDTLTPALRGRLRDDAAKTVENLLEKAQKAASEAETARIAAQTAAAPLNSIARSPLGVPGVDLAKISALEHQIQTLNDRIVGLEARLAAGVQDESAAGYSEAWARSSALWAEHMPDTLPDNAVKVMDISGDHWSARWWANQADNAFGRLTDLYLGAATEPPTTNLVGGPIETGAIYYNTADGQPYVWDGANWVPFWTPNRAVTASLWYVAAAGQSVFNFSTPDQNGNTFTLDAAHPETVDVHLNGVRLTPALGGAESDFAINVAASRLTLARPLRAGDAVAVDLLLPPEKLAPGAVTVWALKTVPVPNGAATAFALSTKAVGGPAVNVIRAEELLVSLDGVLQEPGSSYTALGATLTFVAAPDSTSVLFITWFQSAAGGAL